MESLEGASHSGVSGLESANAKLLPGSPQSPGRNRGRWGRGPTLMTESA